VHLQPLLGGACRIASFDSPETGFAAALALKPSAVLIALKQVRGNGLHRCRSLRDELGPGVILIVYGRPSRTARRTLLGDDRATLRQRWGFENLLPRPPSTKDLDTLLRVALSHRACDSAAAEPTPPDEALEAAEDATGWGELGWQRL
jgi:DNA-binding response OmpR family regulator